MYLSGVGVELDRSTTSAFRGLCSFAQPLFSMSITTRAAAAGRNGRRVLDALHLEAVTDFAPDLVEVATVSYDISIVFKSIVYL